MLDKDIAFATALLDFFLIQIDADVVVETARAALPRFLRPLAVAKDVTSATIISEDLAVPWAVADDRELARVVALRFLTVIISDCASACAPVTPDTFLLEDISPEDWAVAAVTTHRFLITSIEEEELELLSATIDLILAAILWADVEAVESKRCALIRPLSIIELDRAVAAAALARKVPLLDVELAFAEPGAVALLILPDREELEVLDNAVVLRDLILRAAIAAVARVVPVAVLFIFLEATVMLVARPLADAA
jgi:hypothetical protein